MKPFYVLNAVFMFLALNLAFAGGGSEVGDGHGSRASVPMPIPPGLPDHSGGGTHRPLPLFHVFSVEYSAIDLKAGDTLTVTMLVTAAYNAPSPANCGAALKSEDLHGMTIPMDSCKVVRVEDSRYQLVLVHQFPAHTPSREYAIGELRMNRTAVPLIAAKHLHVHGSPTVGDLDLTSTILTTESGTQLVKHSEDFFLDATIRTQGDVTSIALYFVIDQGTGLEPKTMVFLAGNGFVQQQQDGVALVRIPLMTEMANVRHLELRRITVLNSSLQSASFALPESFVIDFE